MSNIFYAENLIEAKKFARRMNKESGHKDFNVENIHLAQKQHKHSVGWKTWTD